MVKNEILILLAYLCQNWFGYRGGGRLCGR